MSVWSFQLLMDFLFANITWLVLIGAIIFFSASYLKFGIGKKVKPVNICDIERMKFIERVKHNRPFNAKWLYRGNNLVGKIVALDMVKNPHEVRRLLVRPMLLSAGKVRISNPIRKMIPFQINEKIIEHDIYMQEIRVPKWVSFDYFAGIYYDGTMEDKHIDFIKNDNLFRSGWQQTASIWFAKSQEQSTFDPEHAHQLAMKEKELQIEMAKKKGKITTI